MSKVINNVFTNDKRLVIVDITGIDADTDPIQITGLNPRLPGQTVQEQFNLLRHAVTLFWKFDDGNERSMTSPYLTNINYGNSHTIAVVSKVIESEVELTLQIVYILGDRWDQTRSTIKITSTSLNSIANSNSDITHTDGSTDHSGDSTLSIEEPATETIAEETTETGTENVGTEEK